jgi:hypothetical protein
MSVSTCVAHQNDGTICRAPATVLDHQLGGMVCRQHVPLQVALAISQAEAYGSAHANLEHEGQRYTWRIRWDDDIGQRYRSQIEHPQRTCRSHHADRPPCRRVSIHAAGTRGNVPPRPPA